MKTVTGKQILLGLVAAAIATLALNSYTIVGAGTVKTATYFGDVQDTYYREGLHIVNPLLDFDTWDIKELPFEMRGVSIPAKDKFKSSADITIMWSIDPASTISLRNTIGTIDDVANKLMKQPLLSLVREAGRGVEKSQDLFTEQTQNKLQSFIFNGLQDIVKPYGITISQVYIQDIVLPEVITNSIITTKKIEEQKAQERARLEQKSLVYERSVRESKAKASAALNNKLATEHRADGELYASMKKSDGSVYSQKLKADAVLYAAEKQAKANELLGKSVTKQLLDLKKIDVDMQKAVSWDGSVPATLMGAGSSDVVPLYHINNKK
ncbi:SPFH domain-containing protein [Photobacterium kishitanii]|uniref:Band 7 domain-containing protein n=1 Tax=Photobacterium kishitanii TaxID=318456 RepID=A0A2T3KMA7_9GAMM|nr:SPFH domain-containing protein [Photobacterium kishitanii]PSV00933.1 hypothetical protein C9J27_02605 [Photobacterium kishitanii]